MRLRQPRRLSRRAAPSFIYAARLPAGSSGLPPGNGRATHLDGLRRPLPVYLTLQPIRRAARHLAMASVGSYPAFSPLLCIITTQSGNFLSHSLRRRRRLPVRKHGALCCPDFPHAGYSPARDGTPGCVCKVNAFLSEVQATSEYHCPITLSARAYRLWLRPMGYKCGDRLL